MVAASGGYWISMNSTKIVASPWTITGSIGVIGGWMYDAGFGDKLGLTYDQVKRGEHSDMGGGIILPLIGAQIPERNLTPQERSYMEITIKGWYKDFVSKVAAGRKMTEAAVDSVAQGRVWTGTTGKQIGLVDELGGLEKAIALAKEAAKIAPETKVDLVEMPEKGLFDPAMFAPKLLGIKASWFESKDDLELQYLKMLMTSEGKPLAILPPDMMIQ
jgi:protease-4